MPKNKKFSAIAPTKAKVSLDLWNCELIERQVSEFGTGAHIIVPKEYVGKKVKIIFENKSKNTGGGKNE